MVRVLFLNGNQKERERERKRGVLLQREGGGECYREEGATIILLGHIV